MCQALYAKCIPGLTTVGSMKARYSPVSPNARGTHSAWYLEVFHKYLLNDYKIPVILTQFPKEKIKFKVQTFVTVGFEPRLSIHRAYALESYGVPLLFSF